MGRAWPDHGPGLRAGVNDGTGQAQAQAHQSRVVPDRAENLGRVFMARHITHAWREGLVPTAGLVRSQLFFLKKPPIIQSIRLIYTRKRSEEMKVMRKKGKIKYEF